MEAQIPIKKFDDERQIVFSEVYIPMVPDSQGDFMTTEGIEAIAYDFMKNGRVTKIDTQHDLQENGSYVVESFVARTGDPDFIEGAWVLGVHVPDPEVWAMVKSGDLNGFSMYGSGARVERVIELEIPDSGILKGDVDVSENHTHKFLIRFGKDGEFLGGETTTDAGHSHPITRGTATDETEGHSHRFSFSEALRS